MQWLTLVPEDAGVQRLKADNRRPAVTRDVDALSAYPSTHAVKIGDGSVKRTANRHLRTLSLRTQLLP